MEVSSAHNPSKYRYKNKFSSKLRTLHIRRWPKETDNIPDFISQPPVYSDTAVTGNNRSVFRAKVLDRKSFFTVRLVRYLVNLGVYLGGEHAAKDEPDGGGGGPRQLRL
jgi:hypothetical protein